MADKKISQLTGATTPLAGTEVLPIVQSGTTVKVSADNLTSGRTVPMANATLSGGTASGIVRLDTNKTTTTSSAFTFVTDNTARITSTSSAFQLYKDATPTKASRYAFNIGFADAAEMSVFNGTSWAHSFVVDSTGFASWVLGGVEQAKLTTTGLTLSTGNLVIGTAGKGIDFSADPSAAGMTSELFDDYEEGTWTPTVTPATGSFTTVTAGTSTYTKIGRVVTISGRFTLTNSGTGAGNMTIAGLPFTISSAYDQNTMTGRIVNNGTPIFGQLVGSTTTIDSFATIAGTTAITNGFIYTFTATYTA